MKVVINDGEEDFALSQKAFQRLVELGMKLTELDEKGRHAIDPDADIYKVDWHFFDKRLKDGVRYFFLSDKNEIKIRSNPLLIKVVEELGTEAADDCTLKIIEVPDGIDCYICSDDNGSECVAEKHRTWSYLLVR